MSRGASYGRRPMDADQFLRDAVEHKMTVKLDQGLYRHLAFRGTKGYNLWFDIITWPDVLTIHGDMGTWTFSRVEDMFTFFRDREKLRINADYWSEKLRMGSSSDGIDLARHFDADIFNEHLTEMISSNFSDEPRKVATILEALKEDLKYADGEHEQKRAVYEFKCGDFQIDGMDIPSGNVWSYHFLWCLYAIVWGIQQYDAVHAKTEVPA